MSSQYFGLHCPNVTANLIAPGSPTPHPTGFDTAGRSTRVRAQTGSGSTTRAEPRDSDPRPDVASCAIERQHADGVAAHDLVDGVVVEGRHVLLGDLAGI